MKFIVMFVMLIASCQLFAVSPNNQTFQFDLSNATTYGTNCSTIPSSNNMVVVCKNSNTVVSNNTIPETKLVPVTLLFISPNFQFVDNSGYSCYIIPRDTTDNNFHVFCLN